MPKLQDIDLPDTTAKKNSKPAIKTIVVKDSDAVSTYAAAIAQIKAAEEVIEVAKPLLVEAGLAHVFEVNTVNAGDPKAQISSVNLTDEDGSNVVQFTWTKKPIKINKEQAEEEFKNLRRLDGKRPDINAYAAYAPVCKFDASALVADGKFDADRYKAFNDAIAAVAAQFGIENPLTVTKELKPKPDFFSKRWIDFDTETNLTLHSVMPTQLSLEVVAPKE